MKKLAVAAAALVALVSLAFVWGALRARPSDHAVTSPDSPAATSTPLPATTSDPEPTSPIQVVLPTLPATSEPDVYAGAVASVVFSQDTVQADPEGYRALLMSEADPQMSARGRSDLERMVAERIPAPELWQRMRANAQWSQWRTEEVWQPGVWDEVITSGQAEPGWAVRNVLGVQTTQFRDGGQVRTTSRERTITIGMRCPGPGAQVDRCRLSLIGIGVVS